MEKAKNGDTVIVSALERLGRSTGEVISLGNTLIARGVALHAIKQGLRLGGELDMASKVMVTVLVLLADLERDMIFSQTKAGLHACKSAGVVLAKKRGTIQQSKLDGGHCADIKQLLAARVPIAAIARLISTSRSNLVHYLRTRSL